MLPGPIAKEAPVPHRSPFHDFHAQRGAQMVDFAGWEMPIRYTSILEEHQQVRASGGLFDVSHMGRLRITGRHARRLLERVCIRRISDMQEKQCRYTMVCNERGGVKDDVIVNRFEEDDFLMIVNGANREKIVEHFESQIAERGYTVKLEDQTFKTAMVAVQGPKVMDLISDVSSEVPTLKRFRLTVKNIMIAKLIVSRTGYTGEDGVEVIVPAKLATTALKMLLKDRGDAEGVVRPIGLGARDTLRMEAGLPLYGHELSEDLSALAANMPFAMNLDKADDERGEPFVGMEALQKHAAEGVPRTLTGLVCDGRRSPRQGMNVEMDGRVVGEVTSGCVSPTLGKPIAIALIDTDQIEPGRALGVDTGKARIPGEVTALPFYKAK